MQPRPVRGCFFAPMNQQRLRSARNLIWIQWLIHNGLGWLLGTLFVSIVASAFSGNFIPATWWGIGLIGLIVGQAQWLLLRGYGQFPRGIWLATTAVGLALGQSLANFTVALLVPTVVSSAVLLGLLMGLLLGLGLGGLQSLVTRQPIWIVLNMAGWAAGIMTTVQFSAASGGEFQRYILLLISAFIASGITGLWVRRLQA